MLNLKNISKLFLATFVFSIMVTLPRFAFAQAQIDCSQEDTDYLKELCEQRKALAAKNAESREKANKIGEEALGKQTKAIETEAQNKDKIEEAKEDEKAARAQKDFAMEHLPAAIRSGDPVAIAAARDRIAAANAKIDAATKIQSDIAKEQKKLDKEAAKAEKSLASAQKKASGNFVKEAEKAEKTALKTVKKADDDIKDADKDIAKLEKKCADNPAKCDDKKLAKAYADKAAAEAKKASAKTTANAATTNRELIDGTAEARQKQLDEMVDLGKEAQDNVDAMIDGIDDSDVKLYSSDELDKNGNPKAQQRCAGLTGVFDVIACKAMTTLADLRVIVYTLAGFGLIAFAFAAIFNKISWKHLSHLCFALFLLSMMTPFINYFTHDEASKGMKFGEYLPAGFSSVKGSDGEQAPCDVSKGEVCPDVKVDTSAKDSAWSWKDLKNTVKSGIASAKKGYDTYKTVKATVEDVVTQAQKIGTAIKNSEGGLAGILDTVGEVATASNTIFNTAKITANAVVANTSSIADGIQNAGKSAAELKFDQENKDRIAALEKKMAAGNLTPQQMEYAKAELEQRLAAVDKNKVSDYANNQGKNALGKINKVVEAGSKITKATSVASDAAYIGSNVGGGIGTASGDIVGGIFGAATLLGEGLDIDTQNKQTKITAEKAAKDKAEKAAAEAAQKEATRARNKALGQGMQWSGEFNAVSWGENKGNTGGASGGTGSADKGNTGGGSSGNNTADKKNAAATPSTPDKKPDNAVKPPKNSVTFSNTETFGGPQTGYTDGPRINLPETTKSDSFTIQNAVLNEDGTITQTMPNGDISTRNKQGIVTSRINYLTNTQEYYDTQTGKPITKEQADVKKVTPSLGQTIDEINAMKGITVSGSKSESYLASEAKKAKEAEKAEKESSSTECYNACIKNWNGTLSQKKECKKKCNG